MLRIQTQPSMIQPSKQSSTTQPLEVATQPSTLTWEGLKKAIGPFRGKLEWENIKILLHLVFPNFIVDSNKEYLIVAGLDAWRLIVEFVTMHGLGVRDGVPDIVVKTVQNITMRFTRLISPESAYIMEIPGVKTSEEVLAFLGKLRERSKS